MTYADWTPLIIVGAPRSGTNMLRDIVIQFDGCATWPCDEINFIWKHHNVFFHGDALEPKHATPEVTKFIRRAFKKIARRYAAHTVVEKTCANCVRLDFVSTVFPRARYIHIVRDGRAAIVSAVKRWRAPFDLAYTLKKLRFVPPSDIPLLFVRYLQNRAAQMVSREKRLSHWGPEFKDFDRITAGHSVLETAALQWRHCVTEATRVLNTLPCSSVLTLRYESFVNDPERGIRQLESFLKNPLPEKTGKRVAASVYRGSVDRWKREISAEEEAVLLKIAGTTLEQHGYC